MTKHVTMPQKITPLASPGSLLKRGLAVTSSKRKQSGPITDANHLACIRLLPCLKCGLDPCGEAAHVRLNSGAFNKRQAMGQKPDDKWALPVCRYDHQDGKDSLHKLGEANFWTALDINPFLICEALYSVTGDIPRMRAIVLGVIAERGGNDAANQI